MDAAVRAVEGCAGIGAIIRNEEGKVMVAAVYKRTFLDDVEFSEAEAIFKGLQLALEVGLTPLIVESDCLNVANLVAHNLARLAFVYPDSTVWLEETPQELSCLL
ncbi:Ribonuclease H-like domain containing protein [Melia azedarach]|uniref:Ribonuclease H-like domain containing protein n=1 Tax=Melia azedarach TaxID=155640 RepID=A0ACC1Z205_MELAZ|nr:Ribonuclease H-like domain containing protein [Melia azedarach]